MRDLIDRDELIDMLKSAIAIKKSLAIRIGADNDPVIQMEIKTYTDILNRVIQIVLKDCSQAKGIKDDD